MAWAAAPPAVSSTRSSSDSRLNFAARFLSLMSRPRSMMIPPG